MLLHSCGVQQAQRNCDFGERCFHGGEQGRGGKGTGKYQAVEIRETKEGILENNGGD